MATITRGTKALFRFYLNRFSILYAGTGAVNTLVIDAWLFLLTGYLLLPLPFSTLIAVLTSILTDFAWKSEVVFKSPLSSRERFAKYFLNASAATAFQYATTLILSAWIFYTVAYVIAVAIGFLFAYAVSRLKIWHQYVPKG